MPLLSDNDDDDGDEGSLGSFGELVAADSDNDDDDEVAVEKVQDQLKELHKLALKLSNNKADLECTSRVVGVLQRAVQELQALEPKKKSKTIVTTTKAA